MNSPVQMRFHHFNAAVELLRSIAWGTRPADRVLDGYFREHPKMGKKDRGAVAELVYGVLRQRRLLEEVVRDVDGDDLTQRIAAAYLCQFNGLSGRILEERGFAREGSAISTRLRTLDRARLPFALRYSLPDWLSDRMLQQYGEDDAAVLASALNVPATLDIRVNSVKGTREQLMAQLAQAGVVMSATPWSPWGLRRTDRAALFKQDSFRDGWFEVQDEASQLVSMLMEVRRRETVVDFCAGAGGKTLHLAALMENTGSVYAVDVAARRLEKLKPRLRRAGLDNVRMMSIESETDPVLSPLKGQVHRVLVDAPCSGTGTLRRNPDIKWRAIDFTALSAQQQSILNAAAELVRPGGRLVYATCSILDEENETVVAQFLARSPQFTGLNASDVLARQGIALEHAVTAQGWLQLRPDRHATDGFFAAVLQRHAS